MKVDNFALTMFQSCPAKFQLRMLEGWTTRRKSAALGFGGALHEGLAAWYKTHEMTAAVGAIEDSWPGNMPIEDWRTKEKCLRTMLEYIRQYPSENFRIVGAPESPLVEVTFTLDTGLFLDCDKCGTAPEYFPPEDGKPAYWHFACPKCLSNLEPIEYGGIFDGLVEFSGNVYVLEHKTTSMLGSYYFDQFKPNNQITGYVWAARQLSGKRVGGAVLNAIGIYKSSATKFERSITTRSDTEIGEWLTNLRNSCQMIADCQRRGYWPMHTPSCTMYGHCEFHQVHTLGNPVEREKMLELEYVRQPWSYENRDEPISQ